MRRRDFIPALAAPLALAQTPEPVQRKGRIKQGVTRGVFARGTSMEDCCREAARLRCKGFDLIGPQDWPTLKKYGLIPTMGPSTGVTIQDGLIRKELHDQIERSMRAAIDQCAANGVPNMITVGGQRRGMSYAEGA